MTEEEMQELQNNIAQGTQEYLDNYDWDRAFIKHLEGQ